MLSRFKGFKHDIAFLEPVFKSIIVGLVVAAVGFNATRAIHAIKKDELCFREFPNENKVLPNPQKRELFNRCFKK